MLVLTRKVGESIQIGSGVRVKLLSTDRRGNARIGIEAPRETKVLREELTEHGAGGERVESLPFPRRETPGGKRSVRAA